MKIRTHDMVSIRTRRRGRPPKVPAYLAPRVQQLVDEGMPVHDALAQAQSELSLPAND